MEGRSVESITRSIVQDVIAACEAAGKSVTDPNLAAFMVKAVVLHGGQAGVALTPEAVKGIVEGCTQKLLEVDSATLETLRVQIHFDGHYQTYEEVAGFADAELDKRMAAEYAEIAGARVGSPAELEALYRQIVSACLLRSGLGDASDLAVLRETTAALESVLPPEELGVFMEADERQLVLQLQDLSEMVAGIRLFNHACGKGGAGIEDMPAIMMGIGKDLAVSIGLQYAALSTSATDWCAAVLSGTAGASGTPDNARVLGHICLARQLCFYLSLIQTDLSESGMRLLDAMRYWQRATTELKSIIGTKRTVATDKVYPMFIALGRHWRRLQTEGLLLSRLNDLVVQLAEYARLVEGFDGPRDVPPAALAATEERLQYAMKQATQRTSAIFQGRAFVGAAATAESSSSAPRIPAPLIAPPPSSSGVQLLLAETTHGHDLLPLECGGYCPVEVAQSGATLPADRTIGILRIGGLNYGFSTAEHAAAFVHDPAAIMDTVTLLARDNAHLIELLQLQAAFSTGHSADGTPAPVKCDGGTQTELHPVERNIDKKYEWNEWELRRKAIKLANIRQKRTHSTQTNGSTFRRENATQVYLPKEQGSQTRTSASSQTPKPVTYIRGLRGPRGRHATPAEVVDLSLDARIGALRIGGRSKTQKVGAKSQGEK